MTSYRSLNHTKWACQYHVVFIPKYRKKAIYADLRRYLGDVLRRLAQRRESEVEEGHLMVDHVHLMLSIPPKYSVADVIGYIKGKSAIHIARNLVVSSTTLASPSKTLRQRWHGPGTWARRFGTSRGLASRRRRSRLSRIRGALGWSYWRTRCTRA